MKVLFKFQDVSDAIEGNGLELNLGASEDQKVAVRRKDNKALFIIHQRVDDSHFEKM